MNQTIESKYCNHILHLSFLIACRLRLILCAIGVVKTVLRDKDRVIVEGVNMGTRNIKGDKDRGIPGRSLQVERTMHSSNVQLIDPVTGAPTRIIRKYLQTGEKVRIAKKSGAIIPRPDILNFRKRPINSIVTEDDTSEDDAWEVTYTEYVAPKKTIEG